MTGNKRNNLLCQGSNMSFTGQVYYCKSFLLGDNPLRNVPCLSDKSTSCWSLLESHHHMLPAPTELAQATMLSVNEKIDSIPSWV